VNLEERRIKVIKMKKETGEEFLERIGVEIKKVPRWEQVPDESSLVFLLEESDTCVVFNKRQLEEVEKLSYRKRYFLVPTYVWSEETKRLGEYQKIMSALDKDLIL
jgi:hypothetical protein